MILKKTPVQLEVILSEMSDYFIEENFAIEDVCNGEDVFEIFMQYMRRYMYLPEGDIDYQKTYFAVRWTQWLSYRAADIQTAYAAIRSEYDPSTDYMLRETEMKLKNDGDKTTTVKQKYDYETTEGATAGSPPTNSNYTTTFDSTADRLESKRIETGSTTTHVTAANEELNKKTTTVQHQTTTMTQGDTTYTADYIHSLNMTKEGYVHGSPADNIKKTIDLYRDSLLQQYVEDFLHTYTFYVGELGGECL